MDNTLETITEIDNTEIAQVSNYSLHNFKTAIEIKNNDFTIISQNIRSIYSNFNDLQLNLAYLNFTADLIVLSECRLNPNKNIPHLSNYSAAYTTKHLNKADGVVIYVSNKLKYKVEEIELTHASCLQVTIKPDLVVLGIYRSPSKSNADDFINSLSLHLATVASNKNIIITGDININLIHKEEEQSCERVKRLNYLNMLAMHGLLPGHSLPTRGKSCLDHFILKLRPGKKSAFIGIIDTTITDHLMIFLKLSDLTKKHRISKTKTVINLDKAVDLLKTMNTQDLLNLTNPNVLTDNLISLLQKCIIDSTLVTSIPIKNRLIKPWMTIGLLRCIQNRNNMQRKLKLDPCNEILKITYKRYRNYCSCIIKKQKSKYDREQLYKTHKNPKKIWQTINSITQRKTPKSQNLELLESAATPCEAINKVNKYFSTIGKHLADDILKNPKRLANNDRIEPVGDLNPPVSSFVLLETDPDEVVTVIRSLRTDSATGWDKIPVGFLKATQLIISPIISHLVNICFAQGIFPTALKQAVITPVYKSGDRADPSNYRPISVLPSLSKIVERLINQRLVRYLTKNKLISPSQFGFRQGMSTEDAVLALASAVTEKVDSGSKCLAVFLDLKKAFDTVSVPTLLHRLEEIGVRGVPLKLFQEYLTERRYVVKIGLATSSEEIVTYGVGQGSVLGPTLFLIYINNLCNMSIKDAHIFSYADDTAIVFSGESWNSVGRTAECGLSVVASWLDRNLLTLNIAKTNYICFSISNRSQPLQDLQIRIHTCSDSFNNTCSCLNINKVSNTKYLGVMLDQRLSWHLHLELIMSRVRKLIWTFKLLRHVAWKDLIRQIYVSLGQSILMYCLPVWGGATKTKFLELERAQRALLKVMLFKPLRFPTESLYLTSNLLSVRKLYILQVVLKKHKSLPFILSRAQTRRKNNVAPEIPVKTTFATRQYTKQSSHIYNILNKEANIYSMTYHDCKKTLTQWLTNKDYEKIESILHTIT